MYTLVPSHSFENKNEETIHFHFYVYFAFKFSDKFLCSASQVDNINRTFGNAAIVILDERITLYYCWAGKREGKHNFSATFTGQCFKGICVIDSLFSIMYKQGEQGEAN